MKYLVTIVLYFFLQSITFATSVKDFTAVYGLYHNEFYVGTSTRTLVTQNNLLSFSSTAETGGVAAWFFDITVTETSKLLYKNKNLHFLSYQYDEKGNDKAENYKLSLEKKKLYNSHTKEHYPVAKNLQDTLGFTITIMRDLQTGKREIKYTIAEKDSVKNYTLKLIKKENLATDTGEISTLKMEHYNPKTKSRFTLWCAESMGFLPIRISNINHKGDQNLLNLTKFNKQKIYLELEEEESD